MNFLKRCLKNRWIRRIAWTAMTIVTLYVLLCTWLNWSWGRQWKATQTRLMAEGETFNFKSLVNDPVPEADNFCAIPLLKDIALAEDNDNNKGEPAARRQKLTEIKLPDGNQRPKLSNLGYGKGIDLKAWADWLRKDGSFPLPVDSGNAAQDLVAGLSKHDSIVRELVAGLDRRQAQWTPEWKTRELPEPLFDIQLPQCFSALHLSQSLALNATVAARAGEAEKAREVTMVMARLTQANLNDPFLIGLLVAAANATMLGGSTWEICDAKASTVADFAKLESALSELDFRQATLRAFRGEMAAGVNTLQSLKRNPSSLTGLFQMSNETGKNPDITMASLGMRAIPQSYFDASAAVIADQQFTYFIKPLRDSGWIEARKSASESEKILTEMKAKIWSNPTYMMAVVSVPAIRGIINKAIYAQTLVNQAAIACALERHRIEKGSYPDSLDALKLVTGKPIPSDVMADQSMGYRKTADGKYMLWSVGFDGKDDGGKRTIDEKHPNNTKFDKEEYLGDWVWDYAGVK